MLTGHIYSLQLWRHDKHPPDCHQADQSVRTRKDCEPSEEQDHFINEKVKIRPLAGLRGVDEEGKSVSQCPYSNTPQVLHLATPAQSSLRPPSKLYIGPPKHLQDRYWSLDIPISTLCPTEHIQPPTPTLTQASSPSPLTDLPSPSHSLDTALSKILGQTQV